MEVERYQSVKCTASYLDYIDFITKNKDYFIVSEAEKASGEDSDSEEEKVTEKVKEVAEKKPEIVSKPEIKEHKA